MASNPRRGIGRPLSDAILALYPLSLVLLAMHGLLATPRTGTPALLQVLAHFLFLPALLLLPFALARGRFLLRLALATVAATFVIVYPPALRLAPPAPPAAPATLTVLQWNQFVGGVPAAELRAILDTHRPDVVVLQEADWALIAEDSAILAAYPHRLLRPEETAPGLALLSRLPIVEAGVPEHDAAAWDMPRILWARLEHQGRTLTLVNAHPIPPRTFDEHCARPRCYNTGPRDAQIGELRRFVDDLRARTGDPLLLVGDMNVTEREPAYFELAAGLRDAHRVAGAGFGASWRPDTLGLPFGLLRIDYFFTDANLRPLHVTTDCRSPSSDHCLLVGQFALEASATAAGR